MGEKEQDSNCPELAGYSTVNDCARKFNRTRKTIRAWVHNGRLRGVRIGKCLYIYDIDVYRSVSKRNQRQIEKDLHLIDMARRDLWILGINALGPLHQGREIILNRIENGVNVRILLLNPKCAAFNERVKDEEYIEKSPGQFFYANRLAEEYAASIAICRDIKNNLNGNFSFEVRIHDKKPTEALVITDPYSDKTLHGACNYNPYPQTKHTRGVQGEHIALTKKYDLFDFIKWVNKFDTLWQSGTIVELPNYPVIE